MEGEFDRFVFCSVVASPTEAEFGELVEVELLVGVGGPAGELELVPEEVGGALAGGSEGTSGGGEVFGP